jgi:hypothetical protein
VKRVVQGQPNFRVVITDRENTDTVELHCEPTRDALEKALQRRVDEGVIESFEIEEYDFGKWLAKAAAETQRAIAAATSGDKYEFKGDIWRELKDYLRVLFRGKCAYCDARFDVVSWGDVEHYRPKKMVTDESGNQIDHPGYYWLAYEASNLLPSCQPCNQAKGKKNQFPARNPLIRTHGPLAALTAENALLFNPYEHDLEPHLKYVAGVRDKSFGTVAGIDEVGATSERVYRLNRAALIETRRNRQDAARARVKTAFAAEDSEATSKLIHDCLEGREEFSAAVLAEVESYLTKMGIPPELFRAVAV